MIISTKFSYQKIKNINEFQRLQYKSVEYCRD